MNKTYLFLGAIIWTLITTVSLIWNINQVKINSHKIAENKAIYIFNSVKLTRLWNSNHNGVYVPITKETQPNPYLDIPDKVVETTNGLRFTKINPAFMTRQLSELAQKKDDYQFHLTSLKPIRPANKADQWETASLQKFEKEGESSFSFEKIESSNPNVYRYMAPLIVEKSCLNCHEKQGYKLGDIRGGISVKFPSIFYDTIEKNTTNHIFSVHIFIYLIGLLVMFIFYKSANKFLNIIMLKNLALEKNDDTKKKFFNILAHDLKSPFNSLLGFSDLLIQNFDRYNDTEKLRIIKMLSETSKNTFDLLENLLTWTRAQMNNVEFFPIKISVKDILNKSKDLLENLAHQKNINLYFSMDVEADIYVDPMMIQTVLRNLISNSIKFSNPEDSITIKYKVTTDQKFIEFSIKDNGVGMNEIQLQNMFSVDKMSSTPGTAKEKGTGLGLLICKEFVEKNGGEIWVTSSVNKGSTFYFTIPIIE